MLGNKIRLNEDKVLKKTSFESNFDTVLVTLVAGKGTRFGQEPKCIQPVHGIPLARHSINGYRQFSGLDVICIVGYRNEDIIAALGDDNSYILTDNSTGGTAFAAMEAFCMPELIERNPLIIIAMGDRIVPSSIFRRMLETHIEGGKEANLTFLTAIYEPPKNSGKGRVVRNNFGKVVMIIENSDIEEIDDALLQEKMYNIEEGNCSLYAIRAKELYEHLYKLTNENAQSQYYLTDIVKAISDAGGDIRTITTSKSETEYDLLTSDVTRPTDLALLEGILSSGKGTLTSEEYEIDEAAKKISNDRPYGQLASITRQLEELQLFIKKDKLAFNPNKPIGIGITGGRLRIAFMHPDMSRFFGPAWQMPIGAGNVNGTEQIVTIIQEADDGRIHLLPMDGKYRESINFLPADNEVTYPCDDISDLASYERYPMFKTKFYNINFCKN